MFEANALQGVVQFDIDPEIVRVQLQLVAGPDARIFVDVERERGDRVLDAQLPVPIRTRSGIERDQRVGGGFGRAVGCDHEDLRRERYTDALCMILHFPLAFRNYHA